MKKKTHKTETTMVIDAKITVIMDGEPNEKPDLVEIAEGLKRNLNADNVVVNGAKIFVM